MILGMQKHCRKKEKTGKQQFLISNNAFYQMQLSSSVLNDKILDQSNMKNFAENKINVTLK